MKTLSTWQWVAIGVALALIIACVVLYFTCPRFFYFVSGITGGLLAGFIAGYFTCKKVGL